MNNKILKIKNLSFSYNDPKTNILNSIFVEFASNEITGILGCNGSGKSTLLDCIMRLNNNYSGEILLHDKNVKGYSLNCYSKLIAYLPQSINKAIDFKVKDFLLFGRAPYLLTCEVPRKEDYERVCVYAERIGIIDLINKNFNELSGGEKELVRIAKTLMQETEIILLDEPTASLDFGNQYKILDLLTELKKGGKTIIFTIHNPKQLLEYDFNVVVLNKAKIIAQGLANDVISDEIIKMIYGDGFMINWAKI